MIWPETFSAGDAIFKISGLVFDTIQKIGTVMMQFEVFPGVSFLSFCIVVMILSIVLNLLFDNLRSDFINKDNFFDPNEPTRNEYIGRHSSEGQAKHGKTFLRRNK